MNRILIAMASLTVLFVEPVQLYAQASAGIEWEILNGEAMALYRSGHYDRALPVAQKALIIAEETVEKDVGPDQLALATSLNNLAELYRVQGNFNAAEPLYKRSLRIFEITLGPNHPVVATSLNNLATLYRANQRVVAAEDLEKRAARITAPNVSLRKDLTTTQ